MDNRTRFQRVFTMFTPEDKGYGAGAEPSGYIKLEFGEGRGKLQAFIQNLGEGRGISYRLYIIKCTEKDFQYYDIGELPLAKNRCEMTWEFKQGSYYFGNIPAGDFNVAAVIGEYREQGRKPSGTHFVCPMAAYTQGKVSWREKFREALDKKNRQEIQEKIVSPVPPTPSKALPKDTLVKEDKPTGSKAPKGTEDNDKARAGVSGGSKALEKIKFSDQDISQGKNINQQDFNSDFDQYQEFLKVLAREDMEREALQSRKDISKNPAQKPNENTGQQPQKTHEQYSKDKPGKDQAIHKQQKASAEDKASQGSLAPLDMKVVRDSLNRYFTPCEPFRTRRRDYAWWKADSPVMLNNILHHCGVKAALLFNPELMLAHFKYRHLIVGVYKDFRRGKEYIVVGIPAIYEIDERPFGSLCRFAQVNAGSPAYGSFGYWLLYLDGKTGEIPPLKNKI